MRNKINTKHTNEVKVTFFIKSNFQVPSTKPRETSEPNNFTTIIKMKDNFRLPYSFLDIVDGSYPCPEKNFSHDKGLPTTQENPDFLQ